MLLVFFLLMFAFTHSAGCLVSMFPLLFVGLCRMFFQYVSLEVRRSVGLMIAVITGKRLLTSVRSHVIF